MDEINESEYQAWKEDVVYLVKTLEELFESDSSDFYSDEINNTLYIELEGLSEYSDEEIIDVAEPVLSELDLDFEDVTLLPLHNKRRNRITLPAELNLVEAKLTSPLSIQ